MVLLFSMRSTGGDVVAIDYVDKDGTSFAGAAELRQSSVPFLSRNIYDLRASELGKFDYVLMVGLIYHLPDPYWALSIVRSLVNPGGTVLVESTCIDESLC